MSNFWCDVIYAVCGIVLVVLSFIDNITKKSYSKSPQFLKTLFDSLKKISIKIRIVIIVIFVSIYTFYQKEGNSNNDKAKDRNYLDSARTADKLDLIHNVDSSLKEHNLKYNPNTKTITVRDTSERILNPVMDVIYFQDRKNPFFSRNLSRHADSVQFNIIFGCINKGIAYNLRDKNTLFTYRNKKFSLIGIKEKITTETIKSYGNTLDSLYESLTFNTTPTLDTTYFYFKVIYSNKLVHGQDQPALRKIYYVITPPNAKTIKQIGNIIDVNNNASYTVLKTALMKNGYW